MIPFVSFHHHTEYSILDGMSKIEELVKKANEYNLPSVGITDHGSLSGLIEFYTVCRENNINPVLGCEVYFYPSFKETKSLANKKRYHLTLLAKNIDGYNNLLKIVTESEINQFYYKPIVDFELLQKYKKDIICLTGCQASLTSEKILQEKYEEFEEKLYIFKDIFKENLFLEMFVLPSERQSKINIFLNNYSEKNNIPVILSNDSHYILKNDYNIHDILLALQTKSSIADPKRFKFDGDYYYLLNNKEVFEILQNNSYFSKNTIEKFLDNNLNLSKDIKIELELDKKIIPNYKINNIDEIKNIKLENIDLKTDEDKYLVYLLNKNWNKIKNKKIDNEKLKKYKERLIYEIKIIIEMQFSSYFLIVQDYVNYAKNNNIIVGPGRGSAAGSLVSYLLNITEIDPIEYNLKFERFLVPGRKSVPDIDVDFEPKSRAIIFEYLKTKYGEDKIASILTFQYDKNRNSLKDVARALDYDTQEINNFVKKYIPFCIYGTDEKTKNFTLNDLLKSKNSYKLKECLNLNNTLKKIFTTAVKIEGIIRNYGCHPAGVIISPIPLVNIIPLKNKNTSNNELYLSQYDMGAIKKIGLLKFDILGLKTLSIIYDTVNYIKINNSDFKLVNPNENKEIDQKVFEIFNDKKLIGVFQFDTKNANILCDLIGVDSFKDIYCITSLNRPATLESKIHEEFSKNKHNNSSIKKTNTPIDNILEETMGVIVFQEQVMEITKIMASFDNLDADLIRKSMAENDKTIIEQFKDKFFINSKNNNYSEDFVNEMWERLLKFGSYTFNKSHAVSYSVISYWCAYLKAFYPIEFMCSLLNNESKDNISRVEKECQEMNIEILPSNINISEKNYIILNGKIITGLNRIKGIGDKTLEKILQNRPYNSLEEFLAKTNVNKTILNIFLKLKIIPDNFLINTTRKSIVDNLDKIINYNNKYNIWRFPLSNEEYTEKEFDKFKKELYD